MSVGCVKESYLLRPYKGFCYRGSMTLQDLAQESKLHLEINQDTTPGKPEL